MLFLYHCFYCVKRLRKYFIIWTPFPYGNENWSMVWRKKSLPQTVIVNNLNFNVVLRVWCKFVSWTESLINDVLYCTLTKLENTIFYLVQSEGSYTATTIPTSQPGSGGPTPPHHCTPENTFTDRMARLSQENSIEKNDRYSQHFHIFGLMRLLIVLVWFTLVLYSIY